MSSSSLVRPSRLNLLLGDLEDSELYPSCSCLSFSESISVSCSVFIRTPSGKDWYLCECSPLVLRLWSELFDELSHEFLVSSK